MNTMSRKLFCMLFSLILILVLAIPGFASTTFDDQINTIAPNYIACPEGGKHLMAGIGQTRCYKGSNSSGTVDFWGYGTQCTKCYLVLVTEYPANVATTTTWGKYVVQTKVEPMYIPAFLTNVVINEASSVTTAFKDGFEFIITA